MIVYFAALAAVIALMIGYMVRHLRSGGGCCGTHEAAPKAVRPADRDLSHYPYHYTAQIDGMVCGNCVRRAENAFHGLGCLASVDLAKHIIYIYILTAMLLVVLEALVIFTMKKLYSNRMCYELI